VDDADRRALIEYLLADGLSVGELAAAHERGSLLRVAGERYLRPEAATFTLSQVAKRLDADVDVVRRAWRSLGAIDPGADVPTASPADVELVETALLLIELLGEASAWPLLRRYGAVVERLTEATSSAFVTEMPNLSVAWSGSERVTAELWHDTMELVPRLGRLLDLTLRHHVESVRRLFEAGAANIEQGQTALNLSVGFADLSGYTAASLAHELGDVARFVADFEGRASEVVAGLGGRIVKFVGDAVMFVSVEPNAIADMALAIVEPLETEGGTSLTARAGVAHGTVLARDGDFFGPAVNLAARLVNVAPHGSVVASDELRALLDPQRWELTAEPPATLHGIDAPVTPYLVAPRP
jgi:class 3 adenylate cyclase